MLSRSESVIEKPDHWDCTLMRVEVKPQMLSWARKGAGYAPDALAHRFPKNAEWEQGATHPTLKQIESFAKATRTPIGFLFLQEPPVEHIPIPDFSHRP